MNHENITDRLNKVILESVANDLVSIGEVRQMAKEIPVKDADFNLLLRSVLLQLLESGVEIGHTFNKDGHYVEFIGWRGTPEQKATRVLALMANVSPDADFAAWLALQSNVDRYEGPSETGYEPAR